jgi:polyhydroxyalkanoate synthesis regulator phasin
MSDMFTKALLSGLGLASLTKDAIKKTVEDLVDRSKISEEEGRRLVKDFQRRSTETQKDVEKKVKTAVNKVLKNLNLEVVSAGSKRGKSGRKSGGGRGASKGPKV